MFALGQIEALFEKIGILRDSASSEGCEADLAVVDSVALVEVVQEAKRLKVLNQQLLLGRHEHRHGDSVYLFLVPAGVEFGEDEFGRRLQKDFEPDKEEFLSVEMMCEPTIITGTEDVDAIVAFINEHGDWWHDQVQVRVDRTGQEELTAWLSFAQVAKTPDMVKYALTQFLGFVEGRVINWLESDDDCTENVLFANASAAIGKSDEYVAALKAHVLGAVAA